MATTGKDSNPGTVAQPYRTVAKGIESLARGAARFIRAGDYYNKAPDGTQDGFLYVFDRAGGTAESWLTVCGYPGERPRLHANNTDSGAVFISGTSGISSLWPSAEPGNDGLPYGVYMVGNLIWDNYMSDSIYNPKSAFGLTDGNCIIIDENAHFTDAGRSRTLIKNDICMANGGPGVAVTRSKGVDIINNTFYRNNRTSLPTVVNHGEFMCQSMDKSEKIENRTVFTRCEDVVYRDNVIVGGPNARPSSPTSARRASRRPATCGCARGSLRPRTTSCYPTAPRWWRRPTSPILPAMIGAPSAARARAAHCGHCCCSRRGCYVAATIASAGSSAREARRQSVRQWSTTR